MLIMLFIKKLKAISGYEVAFSLWVWLRNLFNCELLTLDNVNALGQSLLGCIDVGL